MKKRTTPQTNHNYLIASNEYWSQIEHFTQLDIKDDNTEEQVTQILKMCGYGSILDVGCGKGALVRELLRRGIKVQGMDISPTVIEANRKVLPDFFMEGSILSLPWKDESFDTVVAINLLDYLHEDDVQQAIKELYRVTSRFVFCTISVNEHTDNKWHLINKNRAWWEKQFFCAGFRKHTLFMTQVPYELLQDEKGSILLVFEKIPYYSLEEYPKEDLGEIKDTLRESGIEADAFHSRYISILKYIRPHDIVVDMSCKTGAGAAALWDGSNAQKVIGVDSSSLYIDYAKRNFTLYRPGLVYKQVNAYNFDWLSPNSIDVAILFDTIKNSNELEVFLQHVQELLRPGGRIIISIQGYYKIEIDIKKTIVETIEPFFYVEEVINQSTSGENSTEQSSTEVQGESNSSNIESIVIVAMKNPVDNRVSYKETVHWITGEYPMQSSYNYEEAYEYPWIQHAFVSMGIRAHSPVLLHKIGEEIIRKSSPFSADKGAALCIKGYQVLENKQPNYKDIEDIIEQLILYTSRSPVTPMQVRWSISCLYLLAQLYLKKGDNKAARDTFEKCTSIDFLCFSPTLATKIVSASLQIGILSLAKNDIANARSWWKKAIYEANRAFTVDWNQWLGTIEEPLTYGLKEASQVLELASQAAFALWLTADGKQIRPKAMHDIIEFSSQAQLRWLLQRDKNLVEISKEVNHLYSWIDELEEALEWNKAHARNIEEWANEIKLGNKWVEEKLNEAKKEIEQRDQRIADLKQWIEQLETGKKWLENKLEEVESRLEEIEQKSE